MAGAVQLKTRPNYLSHVVSETWVVVRVHETSLLWSSESADGVAVLCLRLAYKWLYVKRCLTPSSSCSTGHGLRSGLRS
jgi:hypothetical protein